MMALAKALGQRNFDCWNFEDEQKLANLKQRIVADETDSS
jgi:hypothetical protein